MNKNIISAAVAATLSLVHLSETAEDMYRGSWYALPGINYMHTDSDLDSDSGGGFY